MSYDIRLIDTRTEHPVHVNNHKTGGTVAIGGSSRATCSITYNFAYFFYNEIDEDDGIRWLDGKEAGDTIPVLEEAVETLGTDPHGDVDSYWIPCPGNAGRDLKKLLEWAREHPEAVWEAI